MSKRMCGECRYLIVNRKKDGMCWCEDLKKWMNADSEEADDCRRFFSRPWGTESIGKEAIKEAKAYRREHRPYRSIGFDFYITTAIFRLLGLSLESEQYKKLVSFRHNYLQKHPEYRDMLLRYDTIGPVLASAMENDENAQQLAIDLYKIYIIGSISYIDDGDLEKAFILYNEMVECLARQYGVLPFIPDEVKKRYDQEDGGKGSIKLKRGTN